MILFKTLRTHRPTFLADGTIDVYAPTSWRKMTQRQLRYVLLLLSMFENLDSVKTYMLMRFGGVHVKGYTQRVTHDQPLGYSCWIRAAWWKPRKWFTLEAWQVESMIRQFDFIDSFDGMDVRLERIHGCRAVDDILDHYPFGDYLIAEQYYQLAINSGKQEMIEKLATFLYECRGIIRINHFPWRWIGWKHPRSLKLSPEELMGTLRWFAHVKMYFAERWPHFFRRVDSTIEELDIDIMGAMDTQLRALTEGDITKEAVIKQLPCWRALTELNEKAREAKEFHDKYDKK